MRRALPALLALFAVAGCSSDVDADTPVDPVITTSSVVESSVQQAAPPLTAAPSAVPPEELGVAELLGLDSSRTFDAPAQECLLQAGVEPPPDTESREWRAVHGFGVVDGVQAEPVDRAAINDALARCPRAQPVGDPELRNALAAEWNRLRLEAAADPRLAAAHQDWERCMADSGFEVSDIAEEVFWLTMRLVNAGEDPDVVRADEIALAVADYDCSAAKREVEALIDEEIENDFLERHADELLTLRSGFEVS